MLFHLPCNRLCNRLRLHRQRFHQPNPLQERLGILASAVAGVVVSGLPPPLKPLSVDAFVNSITKYDTQHTRTHAYKKPREAFPNCAPSHPGPSKPTAFLGLCSPDHGINH